MRYNRHLSELILLVPLLIVQTWLVYAVLRALRGRGRIFISASIIIALAATLMFASLSLSYSFSWIYLPWLFKFYYFLGGVHTVSIIWMAASGSAFLIYRVYRFFYDRIPADTSPSRRRLIQTAGCMAIAAPVAAMAYGGFVQRTKFEVREVDLPVPDLHPDLAGLKILQLSDVHLSAYLSEKEFARVIDASNELRPNIALMTGDLISDGGDPLDACLRQLARLRSDAGTLGCLGNHESYTGTEDYTTEQGKKLGMQFLRHENRQLRFGGGILNLAGIDYQRLNMKDHYLEGMESLIVPGATNLLMSHNPDVFPVAARQGWNVTVSGHTHGGQVTFEILDQTVNLARIYTRYVAGLYRNGPSACYVTRGIGTIGIPIRLNVAPEITLLRLRKA